MPVLVNISLHCKLLVVQLLSLSQNCVQGIGVTSSKTVDPKQNGVEFWKYKHAAQQCFSVKPAPYAIIEM